MNVIPPEVQQMIDDLRIVSFALDDVRLFLDTHPTDEDALDYYADFQILRNELLENLSDAGFPMLADNVDTAQGWGWLTPPWPWEQED